jgi:hypothetical protein
LIVGGHVRLWDAMSQSSDIAPQSAAHLNERRKGQILLTALNPSNVTAI